MTASLADKRAGGMDGRKPAPSAGRAVGAWLAATLTASAAIVLGFTVLDHLHSPLTPAQVGHNLRTAIPLSLYVSIAVAIATALPMIGTVFLMRVARIRRGVGDVLLGGVLGAGLIRLLYSATLDDRAIESTLLFLIAGMLGGFTYWHLAGRPRPPY